MLASWRRIGRRLRVGGGEQAADEESEGGEGGEGVVLLARGEGEEAEDEAGPEEESECWFALAGCCVGSQGADAG